MVLTIKLVMVLIVIGRYCTDGISVILVWVAVRKGRGKAKNRAVCMTAYGIGLACMTYLRIPPLVQQLSGILLTLMTDIGMTRAIL